MKTTIPTQLLLNTVILAERIVGKKESLPVLSCVLLEAGKQLVVRSTNLEAGIEITIPCDVQEKGVVAVPVGIFSQTLRSLHGDKVTLSIDDLNLLLESRGSKTVVKAVPHDEFPVLSQEKKGVQTIVVPRGLLLEGVRSVLYAASTSMIRPELGSVCISLKDGKLICVATDSFRLAEKNIPVQSEEGVSNLLVPLKHAAELLYVLEKIQDERVTLGLEEAELVVSGNGVRFVSRIIDGSFPNYKEIIPKTATTEVVLLKGDFIDMLRKARVFSGTEQRVGLHVYPSKKTFSATARSADVGEMSDSLDAALSGEDLDINFHIGYLSDGLASINADSMSLSFAGAGKPLVIRGMGDASFMYLVMPLNR